MNKNTIMVLCFGLLAATAIMVCVLIYSGVQKHRNNKTVYVNEASLNKVNDIDELHMMKYPYKGIAKRVQLIEKKNGRMEEKLLYKVAYKGWTTIGTKKQITFDVDNTQKVIKVNIPEPEVIDYKVDFNSINYIFEKNSYETETVSADSYKLCIEQMKEKIDCDEGLKKKAKNNTANTVMSYVSSIYPAYKVICD